MKIGMLLSAENYDGACMAAYEYTIATPNQRRETLLLVMPTSVLIPTMNHKNKTVLGGNMAVRIMKCLPTHHQFLCLFRIIHERSLHRVIRSLWKGSESLRKYKSILETFCDCEAPSSLSRY